MGAFLITKNPIQHFAQIVENAKHQQLHFLKSIDLNGTTIHLFKGNANAYIELNEGALWGFIVGTALYKQHPIALTTTAILKDYEANSFDPKALKGSFALCIGTKDQIEIWNDVAGLQHLYIDDKEKIISTSFNILMHAKSKAQIHLDTVTEQIVTGIQLGKETLVKGVYAFNKAGFNSYKNFNCTVIGLNRPSIDSTPYASIKHAVQSQNEALIYYHQQVAFNIGNEVVDLGLSAGFDSRLALALLENAKIKYQIHTHWKPKADIEITIATQMATTVAKPLIQVPVSMTNAMSHGDIANNLLQSFYFYDGQARLNHGWTRAYRTAQYRLDVLQNATVGWSGIGGEQYRNANYLQWKNYSFKSWIKEYVIGNVVTDALPKVAIDALVDTFSEKIDNALHIASNKIDKLQIKRYYNEIWMPSGPGYRNSCEQQISWFLSPFLDPDISNMAYKLVPNLGIHGEIEAAMITQLNPQLAGLNSAYGYPLNAFPYSYYLKTWLQYAPSFEFRNTLRKLKAKPKKGLHSTLNLFPELITYTQKVAELKLPFNIAPLLHHQHIMDRIVAIGYWMTFFEDKLTYND